MNQQTQNQQDRSGFDITSSSVPLPDWNKYPAYPGDENTRGMSIDLDRDGGGLVSGRPIDGQNPAR